MISMNLAPNIFVKLVSLEKTAYGLNVTMISRFYHANISNQ